MAASFFVILLDPSASHLRLPSAYVSKHLENKIPKGPVILFVNGGYSWRLKIKKIGDDYCFTDGWNNVVQDIQLGFGDFLCFRPLDQSTFEMTIYRPSGSEKILPPKGDHDGTGGVEYVVTEDDENDQVNGEKEDDDDPYFTPIITKTHTKVLRFPVKFAELAGIDGEGTMVMKNLAGKEWHLGLKMEKTLGKNRYYLTTGWSGFRLENDLSEGDECVIKFIRSEGKLLLVKIPKQEWAARQPQPSGKNQVIDVEKRKRGRPPKQPHISGERVREVMKIKRGEIM
ncbi:putative transcription factor B3-Domain family [Helianthus annuus]|uniref:Putative DNA-binding pseudobarrel domain-containing protein n=1 Tax=Helianthus annuus TaxID=4232 RepID=A0A251UR53_HELAN|nr:B3 domain-containing protein REM9 [Helianthus annuus]XP_035846651.1 B3 domain-containing protein REM9 [Helianthus annuus]KAF5806702.1 putative transcription factor B3-Domain family [Helianthus annuus]KAJ0919789.1 putative transcription factor B3-Domain family [Helianthus annuus]